MSVAIEKPAFAYQKCPLSMQVPSRDLSNALVTGIHWNIVAVTEAMQYITTHVKTKRQAHLNHLVFPKIRRYSSKIEALVRFKQAL